jgi:heme exporter protein A
LPGAGPNDVGMKLQSLTAEKLTCLRGGRLVFRDLSFAVAAGGALALEGANGAGKTSLLRMIAGFLAPAVGSIALRSEGTTAIEGEDRAGLVGWLGHLDAAKPQMRVAEMLSFYASFYEAPTDFAAVAAALDTVGLSRLRDLPCQYLSAGQKKRLALARLQLTARPLWLMDEPLAALDVSGKGLAGQLIREHCRSGGIAVVATHEALGIDCDRLTLGGAP